MRVLIVKLSSMGDVIHTLPVVQDILGAFPQADVDWAVEPGFASLVQRAEGLSDVIEVPLRRLMRRWWSAGSWSEWGRVRENLQQHTYDAVLDLQGLTKSALVAWTALGRRYALAARTEGSGYEAPTRWVADQLVPTAFHIHALDRSRAMAAQALGYTVSGPPRFGLRVDPPTSPQPPTVAFLHGASRDDKLWPESDWLALGQGLIAEGWRIALPQGSAAEGERALRLASQLGPAAEAWPRMPLGPLMDKLAACQGAIGVDSGLSHLAVAFDLPHVQIYNFPTAWRTGPLESHGHRHQRAIEGKPTPLLEAVRAAWREVLAASDDTKGPGSTACPDTHEGAQATPFGHVGSDGGKTGRSDASRLQVSASSRHSRS